MKLLFLDDEREPDDVYWIEFNYSKYDVTIVRNAAEFLDAIKKDSYDVISYDNDLSIGQLEGYYIFQELCGMYMDAKINWFPSTLIFHTMNDIARSNMVSFANNFSEWYSLDTKVITHGR